MTYDFCLNEIIKPDYYDYLVWVTAKDMVFDAKLGKIVEVNSEFKNNSLETLINETIKTVEYEDYLDEDFETRLNLFIEIVCSEKIFFVLDNLESVHDQDQEFFEFIKRFNKFARNNPDLKILTTSRRRTRIADFPIEIEGLRMNDALKMLESLARSNAVPINAILKVSDFQRRTII